MLQKDDVVAAMPAHLRSAVSQGLVDKVILFRSALRPINEAVAAGARQFKACDVLQVSERTFRRWNKGGVVQSDQRPLVQRPEPLNKLSEAERKVVLDVCNSVDLSALPPSQIVLKLADQGQYLASEASFYRIFALMDNSITEAARSRLSNASHQPAIRQLRDAKFGPETSHGCLGQSLACSFIST